MGPTKYCMKLWRGNTKTLSYRMKDHEGRPIDLTGSNLVLTITHDGSPIVKSTANNGWDSFEPSLGEASVTISVAEGRSIADAIGGARYELEKIGSGTQTTLLYGDVVIEGGGNID